MPSRDVLPEIRIVRPRRMMKRRRRREKLRRKRRVSVQPYWINLGERRRLISPQTRSATFLISSHLTLLQDREELKKLISTHNILEEAEIDYINVLLVGEIGNVSHITLTLHFSVSRSGEEFVLQ